MGYAEVNRDAFLQRAADVFPGYHPELSEHPYPRPSERPTRLGGSPAAVYVPVARVAGSGVLGFVFELRDAFNAVWSACRRLSSAVVGHAPPKAAGPPPNRESFHLAVAREAFVTDRIDLDAYERAVAHVLAGGWLREDASIPDADANGLPSPGGLPPAADPRMELIYYR